MNIHVMMSSSGNTRFNIQYNKRYPKTSLLNADPLFVVANIFGIFRSSGDVESNNQILQKWFIIRSFWSISSLMFNRLWSRTGKQKQHVIEALALIISYAISQAITEHQRPLLLTWFNLNPSMDK